METITHQDWTDRFLLEGVIGRGGLGEVLLVLDTHLDRQVAIKRLHTEVIGGSTTRHQTMIEARNLARLVHGNIVAVYDVCEEGDDIVVVMEYIPGRTLQDIAEHSALAIEDFDELVRQSLEGLSAAHSIGMIHRDIKPSNIMVAEAPNERFRVKILDFGMAKILPQPSVQTISPDGEIFGSIYMISPEQLKQEPLDARTDLYSLGCLLYYCLTSEYPFNGKSSALIISAHLQHEVVPIQERCPDLSPRIAEWVMRMISLEPTDRPSSAREALESFQDAVKHSAPRPPVKDTTPLSPQPLASPKIVVVKGYRPPPRSSATPTVVTRPAPQIPSYPFYSEPKKKREIPWFTVAVVLIVIAVIALIYFVPSR